MAIFLLKLAAKFIYKQTGFLPIICKLTFAISS